MREILFRGFHKDENGKQKAFVNGEWIKGEWVEGYYVNYGYAGKEKDYIIPVYASDLYAIEVIPETVGQYTGLTDDRNGKKIFKGDIVRVYIRGCETICTINWAYNVGQFQLWQLDTIPKTATALNLGNYEDEVIGNIYDNPELLEGVRNG